MYLVSAEVGPYKSIEKPIEVKIEQGVTVLVGMNESGKTVFLEALQKSDDIFGLAKFVHIDDYPRKNLRTYERHHEPRPDTATVLTYELTQKEVEEINKLLHTQLPAQFHFSINHNYQNKRTISLDADEKSVIAALAKGALSTDFRDAIMGAPSIVDIPKAVEQLSLGDVDKQYLTSISQRIDATAKANWGKSVVSYEVYQHLKSRTSKFMYFGDYEILPSKMNLPDLAKRVSEGKSNPAALTPEHRGILALFTDGKHFR